MSGGSDFDLSDEILAAMPTDPYEQLDLARKITSMAIASRVSKLESEVGSLREIMREKDRQVSELENKVIQLQMSYEEADSKLKAALDDNVKLSMERDSLAASVKKLTRDLAKLETFKRQLMQSLSDESSSETVEIGTYAHSVSKSNPNKVEEVKGRPPLQSLGDSAQSGYSTYNASKQTTQQKSATSYKTPRLTPSGTPKVLSTRGSPKRSSVAYSPKGGISRKTSPKKVSTRASPKQYSTTVSPKGMSRKTSPTKADYARNGSMSSWFPSSQQSSAANSPPRSRPLPARTPKPDGKEFFRHVRTRLSYEQFNAFLTNVKELNNQKQSREETLRKAEEIFGEDNKDLYSSFQGLLSRHVR